MFVFGGGNSHIRYWVSRHAIIIDFHMDSELGACAKVQTDPGSPFQGGEGGLKQEMCFTGNRKLVFVFGQSCIFKEPALRQIKQDGTHHSRPGTKQDRVQVQYLQGFCAP